MLLPTSGPTGAMITLTRFSDKLASMEKGTYVLSISTLFYMKLIMISNDCQLVLTKLVTSETPLLLASEFCFYYIISLYIDLLLMMVSSDCLIDTYAGNDLITGVLANLTLDERNLIAIETKLSVITIQEHNCLISQLCMKCFRIIIVLFFGVGLKCLVHWVTWFNLVYCIMYLIRLSPRTINRRTLASLLNERTTSEFK